MAKSLGRELRDNQIRNARLKTFQVPVWFNIVAEDEDHAWRKIADLMDEHLFMQDYVVNEPVAIRDDHNQEMN